MINRTLLTACSMLVFATQLLAAEVQPLARGPVHEAYADPAEREPKAAPIVGKAPPKQIDELPPDQKPEGENVGWIPGYWAWDEDKQDFLWVSGFWRVSPPGRTWVPGSWRRAGDGWQWTSGFWAEPKGGAAEMQYLPQPPAPLDQAGPTTPAPSQSHVYVPGSWVWRERYVWRPGYWCAHRPGWVWVSSSYRWTPAGYVYIDGYWDYPLASRGVLFAPAHIPQVVYSDPGFVYTPTVVVREECLYGAFFARRGFGCYYFGDYFEPRYATLGYVSWCGQVSASVSIGGWCDPLFSYYRCGLGHDPFWRAGVFDLYCGRFRGDYMRPPVDLVQQNTVINNITNNTTIVNNNTNINNVQMLTNIRERNRIGDMNIRQVPDSARRDQARAARDLQTVGDRRGDREGQLAAGPRPTRPQSARVELPNTRPEPKGPATIARPTVPGSAATSGPGAGPRPTALIPPKADPVRPQPGTGEATGRPIGPGTPGTRPSVPGTRPTPGGPDATARATSPAVTPGIRPTPNVDVPGATARPTSGTGTTSEVRPTPGAPAPTARPATAPAPTIPGARPTGPAVPPAAIARPATSPLAQATPGARQTAPAVPPAPIARPATPTAPAPAPRATPELPRINPQSIPTPTITPRASSQPLPIARPAPTPPVARPATPNPTPATRPAAPAPVTRPATPTAPRTSMAAPVAPRPFNTPSVARAQSPSMARPTTAMPARPQMPSVARSNFNPPSTSRPAPVAPRPSFNPGAMAQSRPAPAAPRPAMTQARSIPRPAVSAPARPAIPTVRSTPKAPTAPAKKTKP